MLSLEQISSALIKAGGRPILVGGCVRDKLLGLELEQSKDYDIEVYNLDSNKLEKILNKLGPVISVGKSFGVYKIENFDISLPRLENKSGLGHKNFEIKSDPNLTFSEASKRRDFTVNSIGLDLTNNQILDPNQGKKDLKNKTLRHVSDKFAEDPLRVLRACQFAARLEFKIHPETLKLCEALNLELKTLPKERIGEEFRKLMRAQKPSLGLEALKDTKALNLFPDLEALIGCQQDPTWHPEGDVWVHTLMVIDACSKISDSHIIRFAALCHDLGKPPTTQYLDGRWRSRNHEAAGVLPTENFLNNLAFSKEDIAEITPLVKEHLKPMQLYKERDKISQTAIKRLSTRVNIEKLCLVAKADFLGRTTEDAKTGVDPSAIWLLEKAKELSVENAAPKAILLGRHLLDLDYKPSPKIGRILKKAYEAQLEEKFSNLEEALEWLGKSK